MSNFSVRNSCIHASGCVARLFAWILRKNFNSQEKKSKTFSMRLSRLRKKIETLSVVWYCFMFNSMYVLLPLPQILRNKPGQISEPLDFRHMLTVKRDSNQNTPPGSPATSRLRVARKYSYIHFQRQETRMHFTNCTFEQNDDFIPHPPHHSIFIFVLRIKIDTTVLYPHLSLR